MFQRGGFVSEREQEIDTAHLRIAQVIAGLASMPIMPMDRVFGEEGLCGLANLWNQVLLGEFKRQAEGARLAFVDAIPPRGWGKCR